MDNRYHNIIKEIHAPSALIEQTKASVRRSKDKSGERTGGKAMRFPAFRATAAVAALILVVVSAFLWGSMQTPSFTVISYEPSLETGSPRFGLIDPQRRAASPEDFDKAFDTRLSALEVTDFNAYLVRSEQGEALKGQAAFLSDSCDVQIGVGYSVFPHTLEAVESRDVSGVQVRFAKDGTTGRLLAGFRIEAAEWLLTEDSEEKEFVSAVSRLIKSQTDNR